jgi:hypothetical protein
MRVARPLRRVVALGLTIGALNACGEVKSTQSSEPRMSSSQAAAVATSSTANASLGLELSAQFDYAPASRIVAVRYTLRNRGDTALAVFDRGDANSLAADLHPLGAVGIPRMRVDGEDVTLEHVVEPLPTDIDITSPPTPVAIELAPGASLDGRFEFVLEGTAMPKRLRMCIGAMRVGDAYMEAPMQTTAGKLWSASFAVVDKQQRVCTQWYDVARETFV